MENSQIMNVVLWMCRSYHALSCSEVYFIYQDAKNTQRYSAQFMKHLLSLFNVCSSIDGYQKKWHKGDGRTCLLVRPFKLTRIHGYVQSFWAETACNLLFPLLAAPIYFIWHASLTNTLGTYGNSALLCQFLHWHEIVSPLQFSPDTEHCGLSSLSVFRLE